MTVQVGGPPAGATTIRRFEVLRGTDPHATAPRFPYGGRKRDDNGQPIKRPKGEPRTLWANLGGRTALDGWLQARADDRTIHVYELDGQHYAVTFDGRNQLVEDLAGGPCDLDTARVLANAEWFRLREDAAAQPWRWLVRR